MSFKPFTYIIAVLLIFIPAGLFAQQNGAPSATLSRCSTRLLESSGRGLLGSDVERVYAGSLNGTLSAFEARNLAPIWRAELGGELASNILLLDSAIVIITNSLVSGSSLGQSSTVRMIGKESGVTAWSVKLEFSEQYYLGRLNGGIAAVSRGGTVFLLDTAAGQVRWQTTAAGELSTSPSFSPGRVAFGTADKRILVVSAINGGRLLKQPTEFVPTSISLLGDGGFLLGDERGNVGLFSAQGQNAIWKFKSGAAVSSVHETDEGVLVTSFDNFVYLISDYNGDVIWKRRLSGRVLEGGLMMGLYFVVLIPSENSGYVLEIESGKVLAVISFAEKDLISRTPVFVRDRTFALTTGNSIEAIAVGGCSAK